ncbi:DedA family protein [Nocardiopsis tropica]|jgi:membrane protein DedA with SNARE-associated domain|uniref:DedA family protein n=1 Tax=Nocardiopsis tropica TaxID=109330 RepID=A0ABU7KTX4_9ACTN|nr:DedA family protein [Nocardiopsis umidischolae]MEE2052727.1 DedA family protein [Nocardiopsis umidischolae]
MTANLWTASNLAMEGEAVHEYEGFIGWVLGLMTTLGEPGVGVALFIETFFPPMPSEAVLPGAGFLAYDGHMNVWLAILWATIGCLVGAWGFYAIGALLGRDRTKWLVEKTPLLEVEDFYKAERFFARFGGLAVLLGRCVPLVRSFISVPAGIERMPILKFSVYTVIGSAVWNSIWIGLGYAFGPAIKPILVQWSGLISNIVLVVIALLFLWFVIARVRKLLKARSADNAPTL